MIQSFRKSNGRWKQWCGGTFLSKYSHKFSNADYRQTAPQAELGPISEGPLPDLPALGTICEVLSWIKEQWTLQMIQWNTLNKGHGQLWNVNKAHIAFGRIVRETSFQHIIVRCKACSSSFFETLESWRRDHRNTTQADLGDTIWQC